MEIFLAYIVYAIMLIGGVHMFVSMLLTKKWSTLFFIIPYYVVMGLFTVFLGVISTHPEEVLKFFQVAG